MATYQCPTDEPPETDLVGCGATFDAEPDHEGYVDCSACGLWFRPRAVDTINHPEDAPEGAER